MGWALGAPPQLPPPLPPFSPLPLPAKLKHPGIKQVCRGLRPVSGGGLGGGEGAHVAPGSAPNPLSQPGAHVPRPGSNVAAAATHVRVAGAREGHLQVVEAGSTERVEPVHHLLGVRGWVWAAASRLLHTHPIPQRPGLLGGHPRGGRGGGGQGRLHRRGARPQGQCGPTPRQQEWAAPWTATSGQAGTAGAGLPSKLPPSPAAASGTGRSLLLSDRSVFMTCYL